MTGFVAIGGLELGTPLHIYNNVRKHVERSRFRANFRILALKRLDKIHEVYHSALQVFCSNLIHLFLILLFILSLEYRTDSLCIYVYVRSLDMLGDHLKYFWIR